MAWDDLLIDTCDVLRASSSPDDYGLPDKSWSTHLSNQACRLAQPKITEIQRDLDIVLVDKTLFIADIDVTEFDRISADGITYEIVSVTTHRGQIGDHKELLLKAVKM